MSGPRSPTGPHGAREPRAPGLVPYAAAGRFTGINACIALFWIGCAIGFAIGLDGAGVPLFGLAISLVGIELFGLLRRRGWPV